MLPIPHETVIHMPISSWGLQGSLPGEEVKYYLAQMPATHSTAELAPLSQEAVTFLRQSQNVHLLFDP